MIDLDHWQTLWFRLGCKKPMDKVYHELVAAYSEEYRAYHNLNHVEQCLFEFNQVKAELNAPEQVELALWFHDIVYAPASGTNEEDSARWAVKVLQQARVREDIVHDVNDLILATKHNTTPHDQDTRYLLDIDLATLGSDPETFQIYEKNIRREYDWVPSPVYHEKRQELLSGFLKRPYIFYTARFRQKYEQQARNNIGGTIKTFSDKR